MFPVPVISSQLPGRITGDLQVSGTRQVSTGPVSGLSQGKWSEEPPTFCTAVGHPPVLVCLRLGQATGRVSSNLPVPFLPSEVEADKGRRGQTLAAGVCLMSAVHLQVPCSTGGSPMPKRHPETSGNPNVCNHHLLPDHCETCLPED